MFAGFVVNYFINVNIYLFVNLLRSEKYLDKIAFGKALLHNGTTKPYRR